MRISVRALSVGLILVACALGSGTWEDPGPTSHEAKSRPEGIYSAALAARFERDVWPMISAPEDAGKASLACHQDDEANTSALVFSGEPAEDFAMLTSKGYLDRGTLLRFWLESATRTRENAYLPSLSRPGPGKSSIVCVCSSRRSLRSKRRGIASRLPIGSHEQGWFLRRSAPRFFVGHPSKNRRFPIKLRAISIAWALSFALLLDVTVAKVADSIPGVGPKGEKAIVVISFDGKTLGLTRNVPENPSNVDLEGKGGNTLDITARTLLYAVERESQGHCSDTAGR